MHDQKSMKRLWFVKNKTLG